MQSTCTTPAAKQSAQDAAAAVAVIERARGFLKARFGMTNDAAARLCFAGQSVILARDAATNVEFCLRPQGSSFELGYAGPMVQERPCGGVLGEEIRLGDMVNACRW